MMYIFFRRLFPVMLAFSLSGCAFIYTLDQDLVKRVDEWIAAQEYSTALNTLEYVRQSHPQYALLMKKKQQIMQLSKSLEDDTVARAQQLITENRWSEADKLYQTALVKLPDSVSLKQAQQTFQSKRQLYLANIELRLTLDKAQWLASTHDAEYAMSQAVPEDQTVQRHWQQHQQETAEVYQRLVNCGKENLAQGKQEQAEQCLLLAEQLNPEGKRFATKTNVQQLLSRIEKNKTTETTRQTEDLLHLSRAALEKDNIKQASKFFKQIPPKDLQGNNVRQFKKELDQRIDKNVGKGIEMGRKLYSQGEIERALAVWYDLRELAPENEHLNSHIERAERVLEKLKSLKKNEPIVAPPSTGKSNGG